MKRFQPFITSGRNIGALSWLSLRLSEQLVFDSKQPGDHAALAAEQVVVIGGAAFRILTCQGQAVRRVMDSLLRDRDIRSDGSAFCFIFCAVRLHYQFHNRAFAELDRWMALKLIGPCLAPKVWSPVSRLLIQTT
ncbi:hypothetical protein [Brytella acorum]|uniref:Uncharacterized protein n=1 Tax=Brytella acorum TaxID=2959299 RepID=A0AA35UE17_9PROT|nr:hypothetical protein [Brytella acorum]MDF3625296.1 hypothetical protein [Brytella acorum]CAI9119291.1 hypothetical protein LMG32879_000104 [Brytella acorum]